MKTTEHFQQTIKAYLNSRAQEDELFAVSYAKESKNIDSSDKQFYTKWEVRDLLIKSIKI